MTSRLRWFDPLLIIVAASVVYYATIFHGWVLDDHHFIRMNPAVTEGAQLRLLTPVETQGGQFYRPLSIALMSVIFSIFGEIPAPFHLAGAIAHALVSALVGCLAGRLAGRGAGVIAGLLFAVLPVHVEAVASIANSTEVFASFFFVAALLTWTILGRRDHAPWVRAAGFVFVFALSLIGPLCKESAVVIPAALLALDRHPALRHRVPWGAIAGTLGVIAYMLLRRAAIEGMVVDSISDPLAARELPVRVMTVLWTVAQYARLLVLPLTFAADYGPPAFGHITAFEPAVAIGAAVVSGVAVGVAWGLWRGGGAGIGMVVFAAGMSLYMHVIPLGPMMAERFLYLPSVGFCVAVGVWTAWLGARVSRPAVVSLLVGSVLLGYGSIAATRNLDWRSSVALWEAELATHNGGSAFARANYGLALFWEDRPLEAVAALESAVYDEAVRTGYAMALGQVLATLDEPTQQQTLARVRERLGETDPRYVRLVDGLEGRATGTP